MRCNTAKQSSAQHNTAQRSRFAIITHQVPGTNNYRLRVNTNFTKTVLYERVWCTTQLAKLNFNHSNGCTHSWRFSIFYKIRLKIKPPLTRAFWNLKNSPKLMFFHFIFLNEVWRVLDLEFDRIQARWSQENLQPLVRVIYTPQIVTQTPGRLPPYITGLRLNTVVTSGWVEASNERALFRFHDAVHGFADRWLTRTR